MWNPNTKLGRPSKGLGNQRAQWQGSCVRGDICSNKHGGMPNSDGEECLLHAVKVLPSKTKSKGYVTCCTDHNTKKSICKK